ncbi:polysaccharide biosynthesis C-terminal domain-containing protein [Flavobacterium sp. N2820]|uniref:oligosaccharide flippase family protein n=1 Tax=Flavobacterium sp. N2820 TaxID=2986834 RepID=UPI002224CC73|nr:polysaccharide biosynthesis C-terminal domain-containing protein [Flavobacterium sp. N2820]
MQKSKLFFNSIAAIGQVLIVGIVYLVLYRYLLVTLGIELLGVWSLIIASTSLALIANFGISTSIIKFVATYYARNDFDRLRKLIFTAAVFIIGTYSIISVVILIAGTYVLPHFIEAKYLPIALEILPFSLLSLIINALGGVISSCLDGIQKNYIKSYIVSFSSIVLFALSVLLTPKFGLKGLIFAQIFQAIIVLVASIYYLSKSIKSIFTLQWNWSKSLFKEIINYGIKMQALSFMQMSFEPITKALLSKYGGLAMVGYYEMASRLVTQLRSLIVSANQVIIPVVAEAKETKETYVKELYIKTFSIVLLFDIVLITGIIITAPIISFFWIGKIVPFFLFAVVLNSIVAFVNICSNPAYFSYLGEGKLNWLIYSYIAITLLNPILSYFLGIEFNGYGVVVGWNIAFLIGSLLVLFSYHQKNHISLKSLLSLHDLWFIFLASLTSIFGYYSIISWFDSKLNYLFICIFVICLVWFVFSFLKNKHLKNIYQKATQLFTKNK